MSHWIELAAALVVGLALGISYTYSRLRRQRNYENEYRGGPELQPPRGRNLTCPLCGRKIGNDTYEFSCGHQAHRRCYADKVLFHRDAEGNADLPCPICGDHSGSTDTSSGGLRQRNTAATAGPPDQENCSYCSINIRQDQEKVQLDCGHFAHSVCRTHYGGIQGCLKCLSNGSQTTVCSACSMPIRSSDKNLARRDCGHILHQTCTAISDFTKCTVCS